MCANAGYWHKNLETLLQSHNAKKYKHHHVVYIIMSIHFLSFAAGTPGYHNTLRRICYQASTFELFDKITGETESFLQSDADFWTKHRQHIESNKRGYGYWIWKPYVVKHYMETDMSDGDILVYADAGCTLNVHGRQRMLDYINIVKNHPSGILSFQMNHHLEQEWTKMDLIRYLAAESLMSTGQVMSCIWLIRKCSQTIALIEHWYEICCQYHLIDDSPSFAPNHPSFVEHRHDQSVWSILVKQAGSAFIHNETFFAPDWERGIMYPILETRIRNC